MTKHAITIIIAIVAISTIVGCTGHPLVLPPGFELALPQPVYPAAASTASAGSSGNVVEPVPGPVQMCTGTNDPGPAHVCGPDDVIIPCPAGTDRPDGAPMNTADNCVPI